MISIRTPLKSLLRYLRWEAVRINEVSTGGAVRNKETKKDHACQPGVSQFWQKQKKAALTLYSLGVYRILLMCAASYLNSVDADAMAKSRLWCGLRPHEELEQGDNGAQEIDADSATEYYTKWNRTIRWMMKCLGNCHKLTGNGCGCFSAAVNQFYFFPG